MPCVARERERKRWSFHEREERTLRNRHPRQKEKFVEFVGTFTITSIGTGMNGIASSPNAVAAVEGESTNRHRLLRLLLGCARE